MVTFKQTLLAAATLTLLLAPVSAQASIRDTVNDLLGQFAAIADPAATAPVTPAAPVLQWPQTQVAPRTTAFHSPTLPEFTVPELPSVAVAELPQPSVEK